MATQYVESEEQKTISELSETLKAVYGSLQVIKYAGIMAGSNSVVNLSDESTEWIVESLGKAGYEIVDGRLKVK